MGSAIFFMNHNGFGIVSRQLILNVFIGFLSVPVLDSLRVYLGRIKKGKSPFHADKTHIHHLLLLLGFSHKRITFIIAGITILFLAFNLLVFELLNMVLVIFSLILVFSLLAFILNLNKKVIEWSYKIKALENKQL
jgi:UDP-GlcNAc:undecaprenyl-phosphate GlcNAc-1-phosphate transferase